MRDIVVEKDNKKPTSVIQFGTIISITNPVSKTYLSVFVTRPRIWLESAILAMITALIIGASNPAINV